MKKKLNILCWVMTPLVIIALSAYFKVQNKVVAIFDKPMESIYSSNITQVKGNKSNSINKSFIIENIKGSKVNLQGLLDVQATFIKSKSDIMVYPGAVSYT